MFQRTVYTGQYVVDQRQILIQRYQQAGEVVQASVKLIQGIVQTRGYGILILLPDRIQIAAQRLQISSQGGELRGGQRAVSAYGVCGFLCAAADSAQIIPQSVQYGQVGINCLLEILFQVAAERR